MYHACVYACSPIYTGFFFKIWDQLFNTGAPGKCTCVDCRPRDERSLQAYVKEPKPDYAVLLRLDWWLDPT